MAPEQARLEDTDRRADVFAAGIVSWEFLAGRRLLRGDSDLAIMNQLFNSEFKPLHEIVESIPQELSDVVMRALARQRDDRFPTAAAFAEAIDRAAQTSGMTVASPRAIGAFVRELHIHKAPTDLPSGSRSLPSIQTGPTVAAGNSSSGTTPPTKLVRTGAVSESGGGFASTPPSVPRALATNRKAFVVAALGAIVLGTVGWFVLTAMSSKDKPTVPVVSTSAETRASAETPQNPAPMASTVVVASAAAPPGTSAVPSATALTPRTPTVKTGASKSPKTFIPKEL